jgi:hypothetical protein
MADLPPDIGEQTADLLFDTLQFADALDGGDRQRRVGGDLYVVKLSPHGREQAASWIG